MDDFELKGIWKGEYVNDDRVHPAIIKTSVPFILKIRSIEENGLFEGMCQDDPAISQVNFPAAVYGIISESEIMFNKQYSKTIFRDHFGNLVKADEPPPDIIYHAKISGKGKIFGKWKIERTFRKINGKVIELQAHTGAWWMDRW